MKNPKAKVVNLQQLLQWVEGLTGMVAVYAV